MQAQHYAAFITAITLGVSSLFAQDLGIKAPPQTKPVAIVNAKIHTISGPIIEGSITFDKGVITDITPGKVDPPAGTTVIDALGKHVYPGLITAYSQIGIDEITSVRASKDLNEAGSFSPEVEAAAAVNPDSWLLPVTRTNGVLLAGVFPLGSGPGIPGRASVIRMDGWTSEDLTVRRSAGLIVDWPLMRVVRARWMDTPEDEQLKSIKQNLDKIRDAFTAAEAYAARRDADPAAPTDLRYEAMRSVFLSSDEAKPQSTVFFSANDYDQIMAIVEFKRRHKLKAVIIGGLDAMQCAAVLKAENIPVLYTGMITIPRRDDQPYNFNFAVPGQLDKAGVKVCISSGEEPAHERNLPYAAGMAASHGLDPDAAVRSVTLSAAEILGISGSYGSIEKGKSATLIVTTDNPLEVTNQTIHAFIDGRAIDLSNKQTELAKKYREKYRQQKAAQ